MLCFFFCFIPPTLFFFFCETVFLNHFWQKKYKSVRKWQNAEQERKKTAFFRPKVKSVSNQRDWTGSSLQVCCVWIHTSFCSTQQVRSVPFRLVCCRLPIGAQMFLTFTLQEDVDGANRRLTFMSHIPRVVRKLTSTA